MARLHLEFPDELFCYVTDMSVRNSDINGARHLANEALVSMVSEARSRFLLANGVDEIGDNDPGLIVSDLATVYRAEVHAHERLRFEVGVMDLNRYGGDLIFRISRPADDTLVALAKIGFVFFDYANGRVSPMPEAFAARFPQVQPRQ